MATTPEPSCFLPSSARLLRSFISMFSTERVISLTFPISRTPVAFAADPLETEPPPPIASFLRASDRSRSSFFRSSIKDAMRAGMSSSVVRSSIAADLASAMVSLACCRAWRPVSASMRRTPDDTALSPVTEIRPISPVRRTWVPPHSSTDQPRALLPYPRAFAHRDRARLVAVFFAKQRTGTRFAGVIHRHQPRGDLIILQHHVVGDVLDASQLIVRDRLGMHEVGA